MRDFPSSSDPVDEPIEGRGFQPVVGPTTADGFLADLVDLAQTVGAPSVTLASLQPSTAPVNVGTAVWAPGLGSYSMGINGRVVQDTRGRPFGLRIDVSTWFSDRITDCGSDPDDEVAVDRRTTPFDEQRFSATAGVDARLTFTPSGTNVHLEVTSLRGAPGWGADSFLYDVPTQQLLFHAPGIGAPLGILVATFHPTGQLGFL